MTTPMNVTAERTQWATRISAAWQDPPGTRTPRRGPAMKTRPNTTACLKLVVPDGDRDAVVARATTGRNCERTIAIGHIAQRAGCLVEVVPSAINRPLTRGRSALELVCSGWFTLRWR
jgi:hypothetical protein